MDEILERAETFLDSIQAIEVAEGRWTTPQMLALEQRVVELATGPKRSQLRADRTTVDAAVDARPSLSPEQRKMVAALCRGGRPIDVVVGRAGAGKTFTLDAVREAFEASGHRVMGVTLAARAARELSAGAGIRSTTAHGLQVALDAGAARLHAGDVVVVDEAAMVGTLLLASLAEAAQGAGAKLVLVGDPKQLAAIEAGGLFAALCERVLPVELRENRRQQDPTERAVAAALRAGRTELAVRRLGRPRPRHRR